jgi:hypothetical protein
MARGLKLCLAALCLLAGLGLVGLGLKAFGQALVSPSGGVGMIVIAICAIGFACFGAALDLAGARRRQGAAEKNGIAHSIWANPEHLESYNMTED